MSFCAKLYNQLSAQIYYVVHLFLKMAASKLILNIFYASPNKKSQWHRAKNVFHSQKCYNASKIDIFLSFVGITQITKPPPALKQNWELCESIGKADVRCQHGFASQQIIIAVSSNQMSNMTMVVVAYESVEMPKAFALLCFQF